jgi:hypothetical protein
MHPMNLESLERRRMLATHVFAGTAAPDVIHVSYAPWTVTVTINGVNQSMSEGQIDEFIVDGLGGDDQINIEGSGTKPLNVFGGDGDDTVYVVPGSQDFKFIKGRLTIRGDAGANLLLLSDQSNHAGTTYTLTADAINSFGLVQPIRFEHFGDVVFQAGQGADTINIQSTSAGVNYTVKAGGGGASVHDYIRVGSATNTLADLRGNLIVDGQEGTDRIEFRDNGNAAHDQYKLYDARFKRVGDWPDIHFNNVKTVGVYAGSGSNAIDVESTKAGVFTSVYAGDGNDLVRIAPTFKTWDAVQAQVSVDGQGGADHVHLHDENGVNEHYQLEAISVRRGLKHVDYSNFELLKLFTTTGSNWINVHGTNPGTPVYIDPSAGEDIIDVRETASDAAVTLEATSGSDSVFVNSDGQGAAELILNQSHELLRLSIGGGGIVRLTRPNAQPVRLLKVASLEMDGPATLDLGENALAIDYINGNSPIDAVRALLASGYSAGAWTGQGITSSAAAAARAGHALGYAEASELFSQFPASFAGHSISDDTTVLVRFTRDGDANLDGTVNLADFNRLAANFGTSDRGWSQGNFNYDANVNLSDFNLLAINFGESVELQD